MSVVPAIARFACIAGLALALGCADAHAGAGSPDSNASTDAGSNAVRDATQDASLDAAPPHDEPSLDAAPPAQADASDDAGSASGGSCESPHPLACGDRLAHATSPDGENRVRAYGCTARALNGPEAIYSFANDEGCRATARVRELETDLDLLVLETCDASACEGRSNVPLDLQDNFGGEHATFDADPDQSLLVVVDGYSGSSGSYVLSVDCICGATAGDFADGAWRLQVDRRWNGDLTGIGSPGARLDESDYAPVDDGTSYEVVIAEAWQDVSVQSQVGEPLSGRLTTTSDGILHYELTEGAFAGGHVAIWAAPSGLEAELTLYGSGVPITSSERGPLVP